MKFSSAQLVACLKEMGARMARTIATANDLAKHYLPRILEPRPAPVFFIPSGPLSAGVVKHSLREVLPDRAAAI
jgi:hypothetical protein